MHMAAALRPLRILVAQNVPHTRRGGMSRLLGFIHDRVAADGHLVEYFSAEDVPASFGGRRARLAFPWLVYRHARAAARAGRPYDVINVHEPSAWAVLRFRRFLGDPSIVVTTHGVEERGWAAIQEDVRRGRETVGAKTRVTYPLTVVVPSRYALRRADHVFCLNEEDRRFLLETYGRPGDRVSRVAPGADATYLDAFARRDYRAAPDRLLWFGTWIVRKGTPDVVSAFTALAGRFPSLRLVVLGAGLPAETVTGAFPADLRDRIEYVPAAGGAGHDVHVEVMLRCAAYVLPSVFEGTPLTLIETMATGLAPVASAVCGIKDVVRDGENGLLVAPRDPQALTAAIARLLQDAALRARLGRQAHEDVARHYTWDRAAEPMRAVYRAIAAARGRRG
ncbi:MAG: glycosyltransferase family 4 protein [Vicinamibacterales bacterium]